MGVSPSVPRFFRLWKRELKRPDVHNYPTPDTEWVYNRVNLCVHMWKACLQMDQVFYPASKDSHSLEVYFLACRIMDFIGPSFLTWEEFDRVAFQWCVIYPIFSMVVLHLSCKYVAYEEACTPWLGHWIAWCGLYNYKHLLGLDYDLVAQIEMHLLRELDYSIPRITLFDVAALCIVNTEYCARCWWIAALLASWTDQTSFKQKPRLMCTWVRYWHCSNIQIPKIEVFSLSMDELYPGAYTVGSLGQFTRSISNPRWRDKLNIVLQYASVQSALKRLGVTPERLLEKLDTPQPTVV